MSRLSSHAHTILTTVSLVFISVFALWWLQPSHVPHNFHGYYRIFDVLLFLLVTYVVWHPILMQVLSWSIASHIKSVPHKKPARGLKVAFITSFVPASESIELLHKTLPAMVGASYGHDTWLLDEGDDPAAKALCEKYGVKHYSRYGKEHYNTAEGKFAAKTKGGNHNSWYDTIGHSYDFVAQIDTDFIPRKDFLTKTLGHFRDPDVAFVGTPQIYGNIEDSMIARGAAEQTYNFYGPILRGFDGMNMTLLIGANHIIRVKALEAVGHYSAHITEDLLTGMKLHAHGWKSVYVPQALAIGEGPTTWQAYFNQQMRWAYGCMHILFHHSPRLFLKMSLRQKIYYFFLQQHYFSGLAMGLSAVGLSLYFLLGIGMARMQLAPFLSLYIPVLAVCSLMALWLQRFNIRPKLERGSLWAGKIIGIAAWPIFLLALFGVLRNKRLVYKVTPKGDREEAPNENSLHLFRTHFAIGCIGLLNLAASVATGHQAPLMLFWAVSSVALMLIVPFSTHVIGAIAYLYNNIAAILTAVNNHYKIFEVRSAIKGLLPEAPTDDEKFLYATRKQWLLLGFSIISFTSVSISTLRFLLANPLLWGLLSFLALTVTYFVVSLIVNAFTKSFDLKSHLELVTNWNPTKYPAVDIFLPTAGESLDVLSNTWDGVRDIQRHYEGQVVVYCLDDSGRDEVKKLAKKYGFKYEVRPNKGEFKKAGNLRHGFKISKSGFIVIFDADFKPRYDFLNELLPYMEQNPKAGIVQSPQFFDVHTKQNWLERGAGSVQELFYRFSQVSRQNHDAAICVGSNAVYRRRALEDTGGTALIEHSEDVHTGFNLRMHGWKVQYVPIVLAKGLCPESMQAFFKQQYRWCMGSMSLLSSKKFWTTKLTHRARLSYMSGFMYYIHTAISSIITPIIPLVLLITMPEQIQLKYTLFILPAFFFAYVIYPLWHHAIYGIEAWAIRSIYGWAHLFAIRDAIAKNSMQWQPTGAVKGRDYRYITFRILQVIFNFIPGVLWVTYSVYYTATRDALTYAPILISGFFYLAIASKVTFYTQRPIYLRKQELAQESLGRAKVTAG